MIWRLALRDAAEQQQSSVLELEHAALALAVTTLLSILPLRQLPPCLLRHSLNPSPFLTQRLELYVGHLPLFPSFFVRGHLLYSQLYMIQSLA